jgi:ribosomal-protein-alanine N-acetyltransferase
MFLPEHPEIETARLKIRLVQRPDLPSLLQINSNDAVTRYLPYESWKGIADGESWYGRMSTRHAAGEAGQFVIQMRQSDRIIGTCLLFRFEASSSRAELGYVLAQEHWGAGYMIEAMSAFIAFAFGPVGLRRLEAEIDPRNLTSAKLLDRLGFVKEGFLRQRWVTKGEVTDSNFYGLLRADWPASGHG